MIEQLTRLRTRLQEECEKTTEFFKNLQPHDWSQQVYASGIKWGVKQVLAHLISAETAYQNLMQDVLSGESLTPYDFDIDLFNQRELSAAETISAHELIEAFCNIRAACIEFTNTLSESDLYKTGYHPRSGDMKIDEIIKLVYLHNMMHQRDVQKALQRGDPPPHNEMSTPIDQISR